MLLTQPAFLWGLLALAIPVVVHLFQLQRPRRVLFSHVQVLASLQQQVRRVSNIRRWLLLALRLLALAALVLAFAQPVLRNPAAVARPTSAVVVVLDNSPSMTVADENGQIFQQARQLAREVLLSFPETGQFQVQAMGQPRLNMPFYSRNQALQELDRLAPGPQSASLASWLANAPYLFSAAKGQGHELFIVSDFQRSSVLADSQALPTSTKANPLQVNLVPVGEGQTGNVFVERLQLASPVVELGKPVALDVVLRNASAKDVGAQTLRLTVAGKEVALGKVDALAAGATARTQLSFNTTKGGWLEGWLDVDDPQVEFDNRRFFCLNLPVNQRLLLVQGSEDTRYLEKLIVSLLPSYVLKKVPEGQWANENLADFQAIVLAGVQRLSSGVQDKLVAWTRAGGGLLLLPPANADLPTTNSLLAALGVGALENLVQNPQGMELARPNLDQPLFKGVFEAQTPGADFDSPVFRRYWRMKPLASAWLSTPLSLQSQDPLLVETRTALGRVMLCTSFPSLAWSDFVLKSSFVPVFYRSLLRLQGPQAERPLFVELGSGEPYSVKTATGKTVVLRDTARRELVPEQYARTGTRLLKFDYLPLVPGAYDLAQQDSLLEKVAFNLPSRESVVDRASPGDLETWLTAAGAGNARILQGRPDALRASLSELKQGTSLWPWFLALAALCLLTESFLTGFFRQ